MKHVASRRLGEFIDLDAEELDALETAVSGYREFRRREAICLQRDRVTEVYFLVEGWVTSSVDVDFERRQMVKIHFAGDILGLPSIALDCAAETLVAISPVTVGAIPLDRLARLFEDAPRLALTLFVAAQQERVMLMDQLAAVGQTNAMQRVCALLLHVHCRLKRFDPERGELIDLPLSQQQVGEGAGITTIHVNRTLRELSRRGLIAREGRRIRLLDPERLAGMAGLPERRFVREPDWLTAVARSGCTCRGRE